MATFQVPQFIERKARIVGPLTLPQFLYIAAAAGLIFIAFYVFNFFLWIMVSAVFASAGISLAFVKINGQSLPKTFQSAFLFFWKPRTYVWQREIEKTNLDAETLTKLKEARSRVGIQERLKSIALTISTGRLFSPKKIGGGQKDRFAVVSHLTGEREKAKRIDY